MDELTLPALEELTRAAVPGPKAAGRGRRWAVTTEHPVAVAIGGQVLDAGGTVADALVAVMAAMQVIVPGTATLAGTFSAVIYERATGRTHALNAGYNAVAADQDPADPYDHGRDRYTGRSVLVPGALRGLEAAWQRFGRLAWADLWRPAIGLAAEGFPTYPKFHLTAQGLHDQLTRHPSGRAVFAADGGVPAPPGVFRQPALARTLSLIAADGVDHCYTGAWAEEAVRLVTEQGGRLSLADLAAYEVRWEQPLVRRYLDVQLHANVPPQSGGAALLSALGVAEALGVHERTTPDAMADLMDTYRATMSHVFFSPEVFADLADDDPDELARLAYVLSDDHAAAVAARIRAGAVSPVTSTAGGHSHNIVLADDQGNLLTCTWTVYGFTWGETGLFPGGICLNSSAFALAQRLPRRPGGRVVEPLSVYIALRDGEPVLATSGIGVGLQAAHLQFAVDVLGRGATPEVAVAAPRFGAFVRDYRTMLSHGDALVVEPELPAATIAALRERQELVVRDDPEAPTLGTDAGSLAAIACDPATGQLTCVTDPRHVGTAAAA